MIKQRKDNLTKDEELQLGHKIQLMKEIVEKEGYDFDKISPGERKVVSEGQESLEILVGNYINLARDVAHKHHKRTGTRYDLEDLLQDAISALVESAYSYDPSKDCRLSTYAYYGITKRVSSTINYQRLVRLPENKMGEFIKITTVQKEYNNLPIEEKEKHGTELDYVYKHSGLKKAEVDLILENMQPQVSLNADIYENESQLIDILKDEKSEIEIRQVEALDANLERLLKELDSYQRDLIAFEFEVFPASMPYSKFVEKYQLTEKQFKQETRKTLTKLSNIAKRKKITVSLY